MKKTSLVQSLNTDRFLSQTAIKDTHYLQQLNAKHLNARIGQILREKNVEVDYKHGITIGWQLVKNPRIQAKGELQQHIARLTKQKKRRLLSSNWMVLKRRRIKKKNSINNLKKKQGVKASAISLLVFISIYKERKFRIIVFLLMGISYTKENSL
jgi:hypothetical protein